MTLFSSGRALFGFILEDQDLFLLTVLNNIADDSGALDIRCADFAGLVADQAYFIESIFIAFFNIELFNIDS